MASSINIMTPACVSQAVEFLTRPLILTESREMVNSIKSILCATLRDQFNATSHIARLSFSFSIRSLPAPPILKACVVSGVHWAEWMRLLGGRDFDMIIEPRSVFVKYFGIRPRAVLIWADSAPSAQIQQSILTRPVLDSPQVPISKLGQQQSVKALQASLKATVDSALARAHTRTLTLAQQLLQSDHQNEADEIFSMISLSSFSQSILSPTPSRQRFEIDLPTATLMTLPMLTTSFNNSAFPSPLSVPSVSISMSSPSSSDSSRPSSRSSNFSTYSFSDDESVTSASSVESTFDFLASTKPTTILTKPTNFTAKSPAFIPRQLRSTHIKASASASPVVVVDNTKKEPTKYLYQGGISTVLTGGVMLGGGKSAAPQPKTNNSTMMMPKYRAPIGGPKKQFKNSSSADSGSWRRATTLTRA